MFSSFMSLLLGFSLLSGLFNVADAGATHDLAGYAWSENVGWFSFNSCGTAWGPPNSTCGSTDYGVDLDSGSPRILSGYAWSEHVGWVTFNQGEMESNGDCPTGNPCAAQMNPATGQVSGWARACSVYASGCSGALAANVLRGDWEGWISLFGSSYGVLANGEKWTGYAWGGRGPSADSENIGWIQFRGYTSGSNPQTYGVVAHNDGEGPRTISCGVSKNVAAVGEDVVWSVYVDESKVGAVTSYAWNLPTANVVSGTLASQSVTVDYSSASAPNPKPGWVTVTAGGSGRPYVIDCDAVDVPGVTGEPPSWYENVLIGSWDLRVTVAPTAAGTLEEGQPVTLNGITRLPASSDSLVGIPYTNHFEIDFCDSTPDGVGGGTCGSPVADTSPVLSLPISDHLDGDNNKPTTGTWYPTQGDYKIRLCADMPNSIAETNESNNCGSWSGVITIAPPPAPPVDPIGQGTGDCRPSPSITQINRTVTWTITGSFTGGNPPLHYHWDFSNGGGSPVSEDKDDTGSPDDLTAQTVYGTAGTKTAVLTVTSPSEPTLDPLVLTCSVVARVQTFTEF